MLLMISGTFRFRSGYWAFSANNAPQKKAIIDTGLFIDNDCPLDKGTCKTFVFGGKAD